MKSGKIAWTAILEIVGIFSIVGSLVFVGLQMQQDRELAAGNNTLVVLSERQVWAQLMAENGQLWLKGISGTDLTAEEELTYWSLAEVRELVYFSGWFRNQSAPGGNPPEFFSHEWAVQIVDNPGLMWFWQQSNDRQERAYRRLGTEGEFADLWRRSVNSFIEELTQNN